MARLKGAKRQNNQLQLAFEEATTGEARSQSSEGTEASVAECSAESLAPDEQWMERICQRENLWQALKGLRRNGGSPGIDGMTIDDLTGYLKQHWLEIREQLLNGTYQPQPVRRVEIPKPDGRVRKLGVPKQWRTGKTRYARLRELGLSHDLAARTAGHQWGPWRLSRTEALSYAMPAAYFDRLGLPSLRCTTGA